MNKKDLSEADIKAKYITPALIKVGWDGLTQIGKNKIKHIKSDYFLISEISPKNSTNRGYLKLNGSNKIEDITNIVATIVATKKSQHTNI